ncbi:MAG: hypothetical protein WCG87_08270 [Bacteroidota bacterium]
MKNIVVLLYSMILLGCNSRQNTTSKFVYDKGLIGKEDKRNDSVYSISICKKGDSLLKNTSKSDIDVYVRTKKKIIKINNGNWPESIEITYNFIQQLQKPILFLEIPFSESGDWNNVYIYYFDSMGHTRAIKIVSSFFNSICVNGPLIEETVFLYDAKFNQVSKTYKLHDDKGNPIADTSKCIFNYRFDFPIYKSYSLTPLYQIQKL